jgi:hypothetical protein
LVVKNQRCEERRLVIGVVVPLVGVVIDVSGVSHRT